MIYGITGNINKDELWQPAARLISWLLSKSLSFCIQAEVAEGLLQHELVSAEVLSAHRADRIAEEVDVLLSFGGDGTLLRTAHQANHSTTPILGINIGRLGFLADTEIAAMCGAIEDIEAGNYRIEERTLLEAEVEGREKLSGRWALNEFVLERGGPAGLIAIDVMVDGLELNQYWADGLIIATPTGSTAYSLASGGPIVMPSAQVMILSPIAPHSLTVRPLVIPETSIVEARVHTNGKPYVLAADGQSTMIDEDDILIRIRRAERVVKLLKLQSQQYFQTLRTKLMWGADDHRKP